MHHDNRSQIDFVLRCVKIALFIFGRQQINFAQHAGLALLLFALCFPPVQCSFDAELELFLRGYDANATDVYFRKTIGVFAASEDFSVAGTDHYYAIAHFGQIDVCWYFFVNEGGFGGARSVAD